MKTKLPLLVIILIAAMLLSGCVTKSTHNQKVEELESRIGSLEDQLQESKAEKKQLEEQLDEVVSRGWLGDKVIVYLILPTETDWHLVSVVRDIEFSKDVDPRRTALEELIAGPEPGSKLERPLPQGVRVSSLKVDDTGLATVDFSREILDLNVGARLESLAVKAIVNTLTEFPEIDRVQILVGGQTVETLAGHVDITQPIERDTSVILR